MSFNNVFVRRWLMNKYLMCWDRLRLWLERLKKYCSHPVRPVGSGLFGFWLRFRSVTGRCGHASSLKPCQKPKILAPRGYRISGKALMTKECLNPNDEGWRFANCMMRARYGTNAGLFKG